MATTASLRSPGQKASSPSKKLPSGFTVSEAASIRANYELETRSRRAELQAQMEEALSNLRSRFEAELDRVPPCIHSLSVKDFLSRWKGDLVKAAEDTLRLQLQHEHDKNTAQERAETEHRSPKKRKRNIGESQNSVPPSPALPQAKRHAPNGFFSTQPTASTSKATPSSSSNSSSRASRKPRKNEQFQAYSMNGSPLDVSKWPQTLQTSTDQGPMNVPSSDFTFRMTLNSFAQGLRRELQTVDMRSSDKADLERRLMTLVQTLQPSSQASSAAR